MVSSTTAPTAPAGIPPPPGLLRSLPVLSALPPAVRSQIVTSAVQQPFEAGTCLGRAGDPAEFLHVVIDGYIRIFQPDTDDLATIDIGGPGTVFGETAFSGQGVYAASAEAVSVGCEVLIPAAAFRACLLDHPDSIPGLLGSVSSSLRGLLAQLTDLKLRTTTQRLAMFLLQHSRAGAPGRHRLTLPFSKRTLAQKLGMTPETLSRALTKLEEHGIRSDARNGVTITDRRRLIAFAGLDEGPEEETPP